MLLDGDCSLELFDTLHAELERGVADPEELDRTAD
jgi:hypothetical protein